MDVAGEDNESATMAGLGHVVRRQFVRDLFSRLLYLGISACEVKAFKEGLSLAETAMREERRQLVSPEEMNIRRQTRICPANWHHIHKLALFRFLLITFLICDMLRHLGSCTQVVMQFARFEGLE